MKRRAYLQKALGGAASYQGISAVGAATAAASLSAGSKNDSPGVPEKYVQDQDFQHRLDSIYSQGFPGFSQDRPNVLFDVIPVGDSYLEPEIARWVQQEHRGNGVNAVVRHREDSYPEDEFLESYGWEADRILGYGSYDGFVEEEVPPELEDAAIQVIMAPGKPEGDAEGFLEYEGSYNLGWTARPENGKNSVVMASNAAFSTSPGQDPAGYGENYLEGKLRLKMHEDGHMYGLPHRHSDKSHVMHDPVYPSCRPSFDRGDWHKIRRMLD